MSVTGTAGLNVPMFIALRRFTLLCTIILERVMMNKRHDRSTLGAVAVMIGGAPDRHGFSNLAEQHSPTVTFSWSHAFLDSQGAAD